MIIVNELAQLKSQALISPAFAQADSSGSGQSLFPLTLIIIGVIVYFIVRSQKQRTAHEREQEQAFGQGKAIGRGIIKTYKGRKQYEAIASFQTDALAMANNGYFPTSQNWAAGEWSVGAYIIAVLLIFFFGLGLLILGFLIIVKPEGTLTVTYELRELPAEEKTCPMCAERVKAGALVCHFCGHQFVAKGSAGDLGSPTPDRANLRDELDGAKNGQR